MQMARAMTIGTPPSTCFCLSPPELERNSQITYYLSGSNKYTNYRRNQLSDTAVSYILKIVLVLFKSMFTETDLTIEPNYLTPICN